MNINKESLVKINDFLWEIPKTIRKDMLVPARIYASEKMLDDIFKDKSVVQLTNLTTLPGITKYSIVMPDAHEGYGSPIGGVFATKISENGVISPGAIGYDQNCGVRLLISEFKYEDIKNQLDNLAEKIYKAVPSGLGKGHKNKLSISKLDLVLKDGAQAVIKDGFGTKEDVENCESNGKLDWADPSQVSLTAKERGRDQLGTLGSGNHFIEIQKVDKIYDEESSNQFGIEKDRVVMMIHTGSRGLGHQIATDYIKLMLKVMPKYNITLPDRELACAPFNSPEGQRFFKAMACGANFAWANRQTITYLIRSAWENKTGTTLKVLYDVAHNIAKIEGGLLIHRKGSTRAFPPGSEEIPERYKNTGQPVLIPGSMGTASYVLKGQDSGKESFYSTCHGAGRRMSRRKAIKSITGQKVIKELGNKNIIVKCHSMRGIAEEAPMAYKDIDEVVEVVHNAGLSKKVAKLVPLAVIKGE